MEAAPLTQDQLTNRIYAHAANLLVHEKQSGSEVASALMNEGLDEESASVVVSNLQAGIAKARKSRANKDMLYGALWCVGGTALTLANIGFIFWGAIVFGAIQFFKGVANSVK